MTLSCVARLLRAGPGVDCLIRIEDEGGHRIVSVAGRLSAAEVHALLEGCHSGQPAVVTLDLGELVSVDPIGLEVLLDLRQNGARLLNVPTYIQLKLDSLSARGRKRRH